MAPLGGGKQILETLDPLRWLAAVGVHTAGHLWTAGLIALIVYEKLGLAMLQQALTRICNERNLKTRGVLCNLI